MKQITASILTGFIPLLVLAQDHGHSHGSGGENEHLYPVMGAFALLIVGGILFYFFSKKKN